MSRNIKRWIIGLIIIMVASAGSVIMATKTLAQSNNNSYQDMAFTINETDDSYIVIFRELTPDNKDLVLSVEGVRYVKDTIFGDQGYPAIIIISNQSSVDKIKDFDFIYNVQKVVQLESVMPKSTNGLEFTIILIVIILPGYNARRKNK